MTRYLVLLLVIPAIAADAEMRTLDKTRYVDRCKGAWAGQMYGVCYGAPYEFRSNGAPIVTPLRAWNPEDIRHAVGQDDCYVEMTFLKALEDYGLDAPDRPARGRAHHRHSNHAHLAPVKRVLRLEPAAETP